MPSAPSRATTNTVKEWRAYLDVDDELPVFRPQCAEREFGLHASGYANARAGTGAERRRVRIFRIRTVLIHMKDKRELEHLGARLRAERLTPGSGLISAIVGLFPGRVERRPRASLRFALAGGLAVALVSAVAAVGAVGYAKEQVTHAVVAVKSTVQSTVTLRPSSSAPSSAAAAAVDQYAGKTTICHHTGSKKNPWVVITVSNNALPAHKAHGDTLVGPGGTCPGPPIP